MENCIHEMNKEDCAHCSGYKTKRQQQKEEKQLDLKYDLSANAENYNEDWNEDACYTLFREFNDGNIALNSKEGRQATREVSKLLGRTRKSVVWHYNQMFVLGGLSAHAGKVMLKFKRENAEKTV